VLPDSADDDFVAAPVTSRPRISNFDVPIQEWRNAGLNVPSTIRVHAKDEIARGFGELPEPDRSALAEVLRRAFSLDR
jgi:hypothetical protein